MWINENLFKIRCLSGYFRYEIKFVLISFPGFATAAEFFRSIMEKDIFRRSLKEVDVSKFCTEGCFVKWPQEFNTENVSYILLVLYK